MTAILESIIDQGQSRIFDIDLAACMTWSKSDPFDIDLIILIDDSIMIMVMFKMLAINC